MVGIEFGQGEMVAHGDTEEEMAWHGEKGPHGAGDEGLLVGVLSEDVADVFETGEAEGDEGGVDDAVEIFVELAAFPYRPGEEEEFEEFLGAAGDDVAFVEGAEEGNAEVEEVEETLDDGNGKDGQNAEEEGFDEEPHRLFLKAVLTINYHREDEHGQDGEGKEGEIHDGVCVDFFAAKVQQIFEL